MTIDTDTLLLLNAYHDGELSPGEALAMERRIEREPELAALSHRLRHLSSGLADVLPGSPAPEGLRAKVLASLPAEATAGARESGDRASPGAGDGAGAGPGSATWRSVAAALVVGLLGGGLGGGYAVHRMQVERTGAAVEQALLAAHLRALIAPQPFDIASSDNHVVKPWFNGRTRIAPVAPDLAPEGFPLVGGRVDVIDGTPVPVMVYKRRQHTISVTVVASAPTDGPGVIDGTHVRRWRDGDLTYWALSDLNPAELSSFAELYRSRLPAQAEKNAGASE